MSDKEIVERLQKRLYWLTRMTREWSASYDAEGRLFSLDLGMLSLSSLPSEIGQLSNLEILDLSYGRLTRLPAEIGRLSKLRKLDLHNNRLRSLPPEIGRLSRLQELDLKSYEGFELMTWGLRVNRLMSLPAEIGQLSKLRKLSLGSNRLTSLPLEIGQLSSLEELDLENNGLTSLPAEFGRLTNLQTLNVSRNPDLRVPPPEIVGRGTQAILAYLRELDKAPVERYEAKLMIVGEERMGKSSLVRALQGQRFDPSQSSTEGIDRATLELAHPTLTDKHITLHIWDFGGQHIYQATHQFFLTRRSVCLLVWNVGVNEEAARLPLWLATITTLAPDARILLVATHLDQWHGSLDDIRLRATILAYQQRYPKIVAVCGVSNKDGTGLTQLKQHITQVAAQTELVHTPWPQSWVKAEEALLVRPEHHLDLHTFLQICAEQDIAEDDARNVFGPFLHDLGKLLYFHDDPDLLNLIVLKPNWITKAISRVLLNKKIQDAGGVLDKADLSGIWGQKEQGVSYDPMLYPTFLRMMERFKLCYPLRPAHPDMPSNQYLVPLLLPEHPPAGLPEPPLVSQPALPRLEIWYRLGMVPTGLMSWLIVDTHRYSQRQHWRTGTCLTDGEQQARMELLPGTNDIRLVVWGSAPHAFFFILKGILDGLLTGKTDVHRGVPCTCSVCQQRLHPHLYDYDALEQHLRAGDTETICPTSQVHLPLLTLLYGLQPRTPKVMQVQLQQALSSLAISNENIQDALNRLSQGQSIIGQTVIQTQRDMTRVGRFLLLEDQQRCPSLFILTHAPGSRFNPKNWVSETYYLHLLCEYPAVWDLLNGEESYTPSSTDNSSNLRTAWHLLNGEKPYTLQQDEAWWKAVSPWVRRTVAVLKETLPLAGAVEAAFGPIGNTFSEPLNLMEAIVNAVPETTPETTIVDAVKEAGDDPHTSAEQRLTGAALRTFQQFLESKDPAHRWQGLEMVPMADGSRLWMCQKHARQMRKMVR